MPTLRGVEAHVTTVDGKPLEEWGVQMFGRSNFCSCYIVAETNLAFRVTLKPTIPYVATDAASAHGYGTRRRGAMKPGFFKVQDEWDTEGDTEMEFPKPSAKEEHRGRRRTSYEKCRDQRPQLRRELSFKTLPDLPMRDLQGIPPPDFHLLATLYIDGRRKPERRTIVYLDPQDEDYRDDGLVTFKTRWVEGGDGRIREYRWVLNEVGIETMFDKMLISGELQVGEKIAARDEDSIIAAMNKAAIGADEEETPQDKNGIGQIRVELMRVKLGEKWEDEDYHAKHKEGEAEDVKMDGVDQVSHTTGLTPANVVRSKSVRVVNYTPYKKEEGVFATFKFMYRSRENLQKYSFPGFPSSDPRLQSHPNRRTRRQLKDFKDKLNSLTPLNIQNKSKKERKGPDTETPFEEKVKSGKGRKGKAPAIDFGSHYRESSGSSRMRREESPSPEDGSRLHSVAPYPPSDDERTGEVTQDTSTSGRTNETRPPARYNLRARKLPKAHDFFSSDSPDEITSSASVAGTKENISRSSPPPSQVLTDDFRKPYTDTESDADDEQDSDMETHTGSAWASAEEGQDEDELGQGRTDGDDQGLGAALVKVSLGKRGRDGEDHGTERAQSKAAFSPAAKTSRAASVSTPMSGAIADDEASAGPRTSVPGIVVTEASSDDGDGEEKGNESKVDGSRVKRRKMRSIEDTSV